MSLGSSASALPRFAENRSLSQCIVRRDRHLAEEIGMVSGFHVIACDSKEIKKGFLEQCKNACCVLACYRNVLVSLDRSHSGHGNSSDVDKRLDA